MKRIILFLLVVLGVFCACSDDDAATGTSGTTGGGSIDPVDTTAPGFTAGPSVVPDELTAGVTFTLNESGTVYWLVQLSNLSAPGVATVKAANQLSATAGTPGGFTISGLAASNAYSVYFVTRDAAGNDSAVLSRSFTTLDPAGGDTTAPSFTAGPETNAAPAETSAGITVTLDEAATVYWLVQPAAAAAPDAAAVIAGNHPVAAAAGSPATFSVTGLTGSTAYTVYAVARDAALNTSGVVSCSFTTAAPPVNPAELTWGLFADTVALDVIWDTNVFLREWKDWSAGTLITEVSSTSPDGGNCWQFTGTGAWIGIGIEPSPAIDISAYSYLVFHYRGTKNFKIGIKSGASTERWIESTTLVSTYGLVLDGNWHVLKIPFTAFAGINFASVSQYFMFVADSARGYVVGDVHSVDCLHFSKE